MLTWVCTVVRSMQLHAHKHTRNHKKTSMSKFFQKKPVTVINNSRYDLKCALHQRNVTRKLTNSVGVGVNVGIDGGGGNAAVQYSHK